MIGAKVPRKQAPTTVMLMASVTATVDRKVEPGVMYTRKKDAHPSRTDMSSAACKDNTCLSLLLRNLLIMKVDTKLLTSPFVYANLEFSDDDLPSILAIDFTRCQSPDHHG